MMLQPFPSPNLSQPGKVSRPRSAWSIWQVYAHRSIYSMVAQCFHIMLINFYFPHIFKVQDLSSILFLGGTQWRKSKAGRQWCPHGNGMNIFRMLEPGVSWCNAPSPTKYVGVMCWTMPMFWDLWLNTSVPSLWLFLFFLVTTTRFDSGTQRLIESS